MLSESVSGRLYWFVLREQVEQKVFVCVCVFMGSARVVTEQKNTSRRDELNERLRIADILGRSLRKLVCFVESGGKEQKERKTERSLGVVPS